MDAKKRDAVNPVYEDFDPSTEWAQEVGSDTLLVYLPGFRKDQLRVQVTSSRHLRVSGERQIGDNKWNRFRKEFSIQSNFDDKKISAKFENGILYINHPKKITQAEPQRKLKPLAENTKPQMTTGEPPQAQKGGQKQATQEVPPNTTMDKQTSKKTNETTNDNKYSQKPTNELQAQKGGQEQATREATPKATMDKQKSGHPSGETTKADNDNQNVPEKKAPSNTNGKASGITYANSVSQTTMEKQKSEGLAEVEKVKKVSEKLENLGSSVNSDAKTAKGATGNVKGTDKSRLDKYKQVFGGLAVELKQPRKLMNLVVAVLLVVVLGLYARHAITSIGKSKN